MRYPAQTKLRYEIMTVIDNKTVRERFAVIDTAIHAATTRSKESKCSYHIFDEENEPDPNRARARADNGHFVWLKDCPVCRGEGRTYDEWQSTWRPCPTCFGARLVEV